MGGIISKKKEPPKRDPRLDAELAAARKREEDRKNKQKQLKLKNLLL